VFDTRVLTLERPQRHAVERVDVDLDLRVVVVADVGHILLDDLDDAVEVRRVEPVWRAEGERGEEVRARHTPSTGLLNASVRTCAAGAPGEAPAEDTPIRLLADRLLANRLIAPLSDVFSS